MKLNADGLAHKFNSHYQKTDERKLSTSSTYLSYEILRLLLAFKSDEPVTLGDTSSVEDDFRCPHSAKLGEELSHFNLCRVRGDASDEDPVGDQRPELGGIVAGDAGR